MPTTTRQAIPAKPSVLKWARETSGYAPEEAAALLGIPSRELRQIERGDREVSGSTFRKMVNVYQRVESILLLPNPPDYEELPKDYRTAGRSRPSLSSETRGVIRDARRVQHYLTELLELEPELLRRASIDEAQLSDDSEELARSQRRRFKVTVADQKKWKPQSAFANWRRRAEELGIIVLLESMPWEDCRGLSLWDEDLIPAIVVNSNDAQNARTFTLFHEYAHLMLRRAGLCLEEPNQTLQGQVERWCNSFSARFLVPGKALAEEVDRSFSDLQSSDWEMNHVRRLATRFRVSRYVMARRLKELGITDFYDLNLSELRLFDRRRKSAREPGGAPKPEVLRLSQVGEGVAFAILDAWESDVADIGDAADVLRIGSERIRPFQELAESRRARHSA